MNQVNLDGDLHLTVILHIISVTSFFHASSMNVHITYYTVWNNEMRINFIY
jgi:hypothetical protein